MGIEEIKTILEGLVNVDKSALTPDQMGTISSLYEVVLQKVFVSTNCRDCYKDAVIEMLCYIKKNGGCKPYNRYRLKNGVVLQESFGSNKFFTADNLTDEKAVELLAKNPDLIDLFARFPEDWKDSTEKGAEIDSNAINVSEGTDVPQTKRKARKRKISQK